MEMAMITSKMPPGTRSFSAEDHRQADQRHHHREGGERAERHRQTIQRVLHHQADAVGGDQQQEQTDTDAGAVRHAHRQVAQDPARMPVTEIMVNSTPIRNTAPSATGMLMCWPSTRLKAVKAVNEIAQPIAIGRLAHSPISSEPSPATGRWRQTPPPAEARFAQHARHHDHRIHHRRKVVSPATTSGTLLPRAEILK